MGVVPGEAASIGAVGAIGGVGGVSAGGGVGAVSGVGAAGAVGAAAAIGAVGVVVPARNEAQRLPRCLESLTTAVAALRDQPGGVPAVRLIVVDDDSTDATARIASRWPGVEVVRSAAGRVGAARRAGVRRMLSRQRRAGIGPDGVWIACTDADSAVPEEWLITQLTHARAGVDLLLGTVRPDPAELAGGLLAAWRLRHLLEDGHPHVHGANLGVRGDTYLAAGGFADVAAHEDVLLRDAVLQGGGWVVSTGASPVLTSGRQSGRAPGGLAMYLRELDGAAEGGAGPAGLAGHGLAGLGQLADNDSSLPLIGPEQVADDDSSLAMIGSNSMTDRTKDGQSDPGDGRTSAAV